MTQIASEARPRALIITIDDIVRLMQSYCKGTGDIPPDAQALSLRVNPNQRGRIKIVAESPQWTGDEGPLLVHFELRRFMPVSSGKASEE